MLRRALEHLLSLLRKLDLDRPAAAVVRRGVVAERDEPETRLLRPRQLRAHERAGAHSVVAPAAEDEVPERHHSVRAHRVVLAHAASARLDQEVDSVKPAVPVVGRAEDDELVFGGDRQHLRDRPVAAALVVVEAGPEGIRHLGGKRRRRRDRLGREGAKRRERGLGVLDACDLWAVRPRRLRGGTPREDAPAAPDELARPAQVVPVEAVLRGLFLPLRRRASAGGEHRVEMTKRAVLSYHLGADRDDVELAFRDEPLDEPRRGDAERVVGDEPDGELAALPLGIVPRHLAAGDVPERAPEDLVVVDVAFGMDGADEQPPLPVGAGHDCGLARHRRPRLVAVGVDVAGVDGDHVDVGVRDRPGGHQDGAAVVADLLHARLYAAELLRPLVELDGHGRRAPRGAERERDHVQHVLVGAGGLHRQAASGARPDVPAAASDECPDHLAPGLPKVL